MIRRATLGDAEGIFYSTDHELKPGVSIPCVVMRKELVS